MFLFEYSSIGFLVFMSHDILCSWVCSVAVIVSLIVLLLIVAAAVIVFVSVASTHSMLESLDSESCMVRECWLCVDLPSLVDITIAVSNTFECLESLKLERR